MTDQERQRLADDYLLAKDEISFLRWIGDRTEIDKVYWKKEQIVEEIVDEFIRMFGRREP